MKHAALLSLLLALGCSSSETKEKAAGNPYETKGPYPVGHATFELTDASRARALLVTIWYPAAESAREAAASGEPITNLVPPGADRDSYQSWLDAAPEACATRISHSAPDAPLDEANGPIPLIAFSHCHNCIRFSAMSIAERLASLGFAVAAPDHTGNTMFDELPSLDPTFLTVRSDDIRFVLDQLLDASAASVPESLRGHFDAARVGMLGHSFGGVTTGRVLQDDPRPIAGLSIAAPVQNPLIAGVSVANIHKPLMFIVAKEDHSIGEIGNVLIRDNYAKGNPPLFDLEVADAGHWSFSDICGLSQPFSAGCGQAQRQTDSSETFDYLPVEKATSIAAAYVSAFFSGELLGKSDGLDYVRSAHPVELVESSFRE